MNNESLEPPKNFKMIHAVCCQITQVSGKPIYPNANENNNAYTLWMTQRFEWTSFLKI